MCVSAAALRAGFTPRRPSPSSRTSCGAAASSGSTDASSRSSMCWWQGRGGGQGGGLITRVRWCCPLHLSHRTHLKALNLGGFLYHLSRRLAGSCRCMKRRRGREPRCVEPRFKLRVGQRVDETNVKSRFRELRVPWLKVDGIMAVVMLQTFRYHQHHVCKVTGRW